MDDEQRSHRETLRQTHLRRMRVLEQQAAYSGASARPEVLLEIEDIRAALATLEAELAPEPAAPPRPEAPPQVLEERRKLVTVLSGEVSGLAELSADLDPEDAAELLARLGQRGAALFDRFGARATIQADGRLLALWGDERSREDDPEQAVRAALALRDELAVFCAEQQIALAIRLGVSTGLALVGGAQGPVGESVTLAARLAQRASDNAVLIDHATCGHVRGLFDLQPAALPDAKGRPAGRCYVALKARPRSFGSSARGIEGVETHMVGRDAELRALQEAYAAAAEDAERAVVALVADAGLGKSRLLAEFDRWVAAQPAPPLVLRGRATAAAQQPYALLRDTLALHLAIQDNDTAAEVRARLERGFSAALGAGGPALEQAQVVGYLLGLVSGEGPLLQSLLEDARQARDRGVMGLAEYLRALLGRGPVVLLLEDLHWADDASLDALAALLEALEGQPLLAVCAARPGLFERRPHWGEGQPYFTRLDLRPLSARDSRRLVDAILQRVERPPQTLRDTLVASADGNPFFLEELVKMLIDDGAIQPDGERWAVDAERLAAIRVPTTLMGVLQARLDHLSTPELSLLQRGAVVGRIFWDATVAYLRGVSEGAGARHEPEQPQLFHDLRARELIFQRERSAFSSAHEYAFKHALLRDVTYERVLRRTRRLYHAGAARWLAQIATETGRADEYATRIAEHYDQAGEQGEAGAWYGRAGKQAAARFAHAEALAALGRALRATPPSEAGTRFDLLLARERVLDLLGDRPAQLADLEALERLAEGLGDQGRLAVVALRRAGYADSVGDFPGAIAAAQRAVAHATAAGKATSEAAGHLAWGQALWQQADYPAARERLEHARALARAAGLPGIEADSSRILGAVAWSQGDYPSARAAYERALSHYEAAGHRRNEARTRNNLGTLLWRQGEYALARSWYEQALALFRELGDRNSESAVLSNLGLAAGDQGDYGGAQAIHEQALALCRQIGDRQGEAMTLVNLGLVALAQGAFSDAARAFEGALLLFRELGARDDESRALHNRGQVALAMGDYGAAERMLADALSLARAIGDLRDESFILAYQSLLFHQLGRHRAACDTARSALQIAKLKENRPDQALALTQLGHALLGAGQREEAGAAYQRAYALREELGQGTRALEPLAGQARVCLVRGDLAQAMAHVEPILAHLATGTLDGLDDPARVELTCYYALRAARDPRAVPLLASAMATLRRRAEQIDDPAQRRVYLEGVASNSALTAAWRAASANGP